MKSTCKNAGVENTALWTETQKKKKTLKNKSEIFNFFQKMTMYIYRCWWIII